MKNDPNFKTDLIWLKKTRLQYTLHQLFLNLFWAEMRLHSPFCQIFIDTYHYVFTHFCNTHYATWSCGSLVQVRSDSEEYSGFLSWRNIYYVYYLAKASIKEPVCNPNPVTSKNMKVKLLYCTSVFSFWVASSRDHADKVSESKANSVCSHTHR